jgi:hypothetical protein
MELFKKNLSIFLIKIRKRQRFHAQMSFFANSILGHVKSLHTLATREFLTF